MSVARHTVYNLAGALVPVAITLLTVPLYLEAIGVERYGVLALVWVLVGYFAFFDLGIGRATAQRMARLADDNPSARNRLFWTALGLTMVLACAAGLICWSVAQLVLPRIEIAPALGLELNQSLPLIVLAVPVGVVQSLFNGALEGRRAFGPINVVAVAGNALTAILPLGSVWFFGPRIWLLISATLVARLLVIIVQAIWCKRIVPIAAPLAPNREEIGSLLRFGGWITVSGIVGPFLVYFDRFAIGAWINATALGFYVIGFNLVAQFQVLPGALSRSLFPRLAELGPDESLVRSNDAIRAMAGLITPLTVIACVGAVPFFRLWLGHAVAVHSGPVTILLLVGYWSNALAQIPLVRLQSVGRPDLAAKVHLYELGPYAVALWAGIAFLRLPGAAIAWSVRTLVDCVALYFLAGLSKQNIPTLFLHFAIVLATASLILLTTSDDWLLLESLVLPGIAILAGWAIFPAHLRKQVLAFLFRSKRRVPAP